MAAQAAKVEVKIFPKNPVLNEPFKAEFIIDSESGENPIINFEPSKYLEVISRGNSSVSTRTSFINGTMTHSRKISVVYDLVASKPGSSFIRKITVGLGDKDLRHRNVTVQILKRARKAQDIFVRAEVEKTQYYVGESILVRYYLYNKASVPLNTTDVKKFPKLDKFLKRYHQEKMSPQRVQIKGVQFRRRIIYTAQLFAENPGNYKVDPISLSVRYSRRSNDPFAGFGLGLRIGQLKSRTVRSKTVKLLVLPLPSEGMPTHFTGLVGKHKFTLVSQKKKFLANEPIEFQLTVAGEGSLELFEAPTLLSHDLIEEFETSADLKVQQNFTGIKKFDYTYLGRGNVDLPAYKLPLSYFDVETKSYVSADIDLGPFKVVALNGKPPVINQDTQVDRPQVNDDVNSQGKVVIEKLTFEPLYKGISSFVYYSKHLVWLLGTSLVLMLIYLIFRTFAGMKRRDLSVFDEVYKNGITYGGVYNIMALIEGDAPMNELIEGIEIKPESKMYFKTLFSQINENYNSSNSDKKIKINKKYFQELEKCLLKK
jgi:hypothetical protein